MLPLDFNYSSDICVYNNFIYYPFNLYRNNLFNNLNIINV